MDKFTSHVVLNVIYRLQNEHRGTEVSFCLLLWLDVSPKEAHSLRGHIVIFWALTPRCVVN